MKRLVLLTQGFAIVYEGRKRVAVLKCLAQPSGDDIEEARVADYSEAV